MGKVSRLAKRSALLLDIDVISSSEISSEKKKWFLTFTESGII